MIQPATINDVEEITNVHIYSWQSAYKGLISEEVLKNMDHEAREKMWLTSIKQNPLEILVAYERNKLIGFSNFGQCIDNEYDNSIAEIRAIYLLETYWRSKWYRHRCVYEKCVSDNSEQ